MVKYLVYFEGYDRGYVCRLFFLKPEEFLEEFHLHENDDFDADTWIKNWRKYGGDCFFPVGEIDPEAYTERYLIITCPDCAMKVFPTDDPVDFLKKDLKKIDKDDNLTYVNSQTMYPVEEIKLDPNILYDHSDVGKIQEGDGWGVRVFDTSKMYPFQIKHFPNTGPEDYHAGLYVVDLQNIQAITDANKESNEARYKLFQ